MTPLLHPKHRHTLAAALLLSVALPHAAQPLPQPPAQPQPVAAHPANDQPDQPNRPDPTPAPTLDNWIQLLDHNQWAQRQAATEHLMTRPGNPLPALAQAHQNPNASVEQRQRLTQILHHRLIGRMLQTFPAPPNPDPHQPVVPVQLAGDARKASLGIVHHPLAANALPGREPRPAVFVLDTLPGFPAYSVLRPGDAIVRFADQDLPQAEPQNQPGQPAPINEIIQKHQAGDTVPLRIVRDGNTLDLQVTLASLGALRGIYTGPEAAGPTRLTNLYQQALNQQLETLFAPPPAPE